MALVPPFFFDAVVALGVGDDPQKRRWVGTGFLYGLFEKESDEKTKSYFVFLISNRHILEGHPKMWVKFNSLTGSASEDFDIKLKARNGRDLWIPHPNPDIDLGAVFLNATFLKDRNLKFSYFQSDNHAWTISDLKNQGITEGDGVYVLGFPMGMVDQARQYVICRSGSIARIRDVVEANAQDFLIDAFVFPGNSGGPVVLRPELTSIEGTKSVQKASLIGVVQSYVPYQDIAVSQQTNRPRIVFEDNSGLASVIPVDYVNELMIAAGKRLKSRVAQGRWKVKQKQG